MSPFPTRILLATDGSKDAELATNAAIELANESGSELHVVYVGEFIPSPHDYPDTRLEQIFERFTHKTQSVLAERIGLIAAAGGDVSGEHVRVGRPANEIVALAEEIGAGLIVIGSRGLGGVRRALVGSVSDAVVRHAHCPVLVVRREEGGSMFPLRKILLATDGSEEATSAAETAVEISNTTNSELHVVHVRTPPLNLNYYEGIYIGDYVEEAEAELEKEAQQLLSEQVEEITAAGGSVKQAHLSRGRPDREITTLAEETGAGLIVIGSRGLGGIRRALIGSVSNSVVHHAHCPVLVVRTEKPEETAGPEEVGFV